MTQCEGDIPYTVFLKVNYRPQWDKPVIEKDLNNDNGHEDTKEVCGRALACLANLTLTDRKDVVELNLGIRVILNVVW